MVGGQINEFIIIKHSTLLITWMASYINIGNMSISSQSVVYYEIKRLFRKRKKMIYLQHNQTFFKAMGINLFHTDRPTTITFLKNIAYTLFLGQICCWLTGAFIHHHLNSLDVAFNAIAVFFGCISSCVQYVFLKLNESNVGLLITDLRDMIDRGEYFCIFALRFEITHFPHSNFVWIVPERFKGHYEIAEKKGRRLTTLVINCLLGMIPVTIGILPFFSAWSRGNKDTRTWFRSYQFK